MHGINEETSHGTKMILPKYYYNKEKRKIVPINKKYFSNNFIDYDNKFGFNILIETIEGKTQKVNENAPYHETNQNEPSKEKEIIFSDDAIIYQSILKYAIDFGVSEFFKSRKLSKEWLLENCSVYVKHYSHGENVKTNINNRVEQINQKITSHLENLKYLGLLESQKTVSNNNITTFEYRFTGFGRLYACLVDFYEYISQPIAQSSELTIRRKVENEEKLKEVTKIEQTFSQILEFYKDRKDSHGKISYLFFKRCYEHYKLDYKKIRVLVTIIFKFIDIMKEATEDKNITRSLFEKIQVFYNDTTMWNILDETLLRFGNEHPDDYDLFLYSLKLDMEEIQEMKSIDKKGFENSRLDCRENPYMMAMEGYCKNCSQFTPVIMGVINYFREYIKNPTQGIRAPCPNCQDKGLLNFEILV